MAFALVGSLYTPTTVHFARVYLEYDLHYHVRGDRLVAEAECAKPFMGDSNSGFDCFSYRGWLRYHLPMNPLQTRLGSDQYAMRYGASSFAA